MAFNANFTGVTLEKGGVVVHGVSEPERSRAIMVTLAHDGGMRALPVEHPDASPWRVRFEDEGTPFAAGNEVALAGMALVDGHDPFVWQGSFEIITRSDIDE